MLVCHLEFCKSELKFGFGNNGFVFKKSKSYIEISLFRKPKLCIHETMKRTGKEKLRKGPSRARISKNNLRCNFGMKRISWLVKEMRSLLSYPRSQRINKWAIIIKIYNCTIIQQTFSWLFKEQDTRYRSNLWLQTFSNGPLLTFYLQRGCEKVLLGNHWLHRLVVNTPSSLNKTPGILKKYSNHLLMGIPLLNVSHSVSTSNVYSLTRRKIKDGFFSSSTKWLHHVQRHAPLRVCSHPLPFYATPWPKPSLDIEESGQATFCSNRFQIEATEGPEHLSPCTTQSRTSDYLFGPSGPQFEIKPSTRHNFCKTTYIRAEFDPRWQEFGQGF